MHCRPYTLGLYTIACSQYVKICRPLAWYRFQGLLWFSPESTMTSQQLPHPSTWGGQAQWCTEAPKKKFFEARFFPHQFFILLSTRLPQMNFKKTYRQLRAGTLEGDSRTPTGVLQSFSQGGALGINLMMLEPSQFVLGGFWNHIMGNQEYDPRTPSFWSLSVGKKRSQQLHLSKIRNLTNSITRLLPLLPC